MRYCDTRQTKDDDFDHQTIKNGRFVVILQKNCCKQLNVLSDALSTSSLSFCPEVLRSKNIKVEIRHFFIWKTKAMKGDLLLLFALLANWALVIGLKLETVFIPQYGVKDGSVVLRCDFLLESDTLLVLKWYKDSHEFYRYSPQVKPNILTFPVDGVFVDTAPKASDLNHVTLRNITLSTGGTYKCEVSADRPSFRTLSQQGDMLIVAPPTTEPEIYLSQISGTHPAVSVGDTITGNCTSYHTKPAASLMFYINDDKAETEYIIEYLPISEPSGLETSVLGLNFQLEPRHFRNGAMELKCTATIGNGYWTQKMIVAEANINAQPSIPGHNRLLSAGAPRSIEYNTSAVGSLFFFFFFHILFRHL